MKPSKHSIVGECQACERPMRSRTARAKGVNVQGAECTHAGHGFCERCYARLLRTGSTEVIPRERRKPRTRSRGSVSVPADHILEDWEIMRGEGLTWKQAAPRIGVSESAMDQALRRARKRGDSRGNLYFHQSRSDAA